MPWHQPLRLTKRIWQGTTLAFFLVAVGLGACGLLFAALPTGPTDSLSNTESTSFWITRGCCLGPAFSLAFLAYVAFLAGRRPERALFWGEGVAALGVAMGLIPALLGFAIIVQPTPEAGDRIFASLLCLMPGLTIIGLSGVFWALAVQRR